MSSNPFLSSPASPGTATLDTGEREVRTLLRDLLRDTADTRSRRPDDELRTRLRHICEIARADGAQVEHMIILLKEESREMFKARARARVAAEAAVERVVTLCIDEYYTSRPQS